MGGKRRVGVSEKRPNFGPLQIFVQSGTKRSQNETVTWVMQECKDAYEEIRSAARSVQTARWSPGGGGKTNLIFTGSNDPYDFCFQHRKHVGQWSQSYLQCVLWEWLRLEDIHYWPGSDREGLQGRALVLDCLDVLSPCISLTTSNTRLHSTRLGTNVSLCGSESPSRSDGIKSKSLRARKTE